MRVMPVRPLASVLLVSEAQTGAVAVFIPLPMPAMTLFWSQSLNARHRVGV